MINQADSEISFKNHKIKKKTKTFLKQSLVNNNSLTSYYEPLIQSFAPVWSHKKCRTKVKNVKRLSEQVILLTLKPGKKWRGFKAGQYIELTVEKYGAQLTRCFSISSSEREWKKTGLIELTIREQENGKVTSWLSPNLSTQSYVQISQAKGDFVFNDTTGSKLLIAGGTGITPMKSMLSSIEINQAPIDLVYFSRDAHLYAKELTALSNQIKQLNIHLINTATQGHLTSHLLKEVCPDLNQRDVYLCGPSALTTEACTLLLACNLPEENLHQEHFLATPKRLSELTHDIEQTTASVKFKKAGQWVEASSEPDQTLLELAEKKNLSPSYGCRMGICHQCKCTKKKGVVVNALSGEISDTAEEEIKLCVSVPLGDLELEL
jgi:ferredoxin-NADP reductase